MMTNRNYIVDLDNILVKKLMVDFAKEMNFDEEAFGKKRTMDKAVNKLLKTFAITAGSLKEANTR